MMNVGLTGSLPKELCHITTLRRLCICRCALTGPIPEAIGHLIGLEELQLFGNKINGKIPASVGNLVNLKLLSLGEYTGGNDFTSDVFPASIERLVNLEALFLANCNIKGPIPAWIGSLRGELYVNQVDSFRYQCALYVQSCANWTFSGIILLARSLVLLVSWRTCCT